MEEENKMNKGIGLCGIFFIWLFGSFIGTIVAFGFDQAPIGAMVLGQFLLVLGILTTRQGIKEKFLRPATLLLIAVGAADIVGGAIFQFGNYTIRDYAKAAIPYVIMLFGASIVIGNYVYFKKKHESCTYSVTATCVKVKSEYDKKDHKHTYCPVYEAYFRGEMVTFCNNHYSNIIFVKEQEKRELYVNPDDPRIYYEAREEKSMMTFVYVLGAALVIIPFLTLINWR